MPIALLCAMVAALAAVAVSPDLLAQPYPHRPVKLVVPYSAGTTTDVLGRLYALGYIRGLQQAVYAH